jgi:hypothetical protein
VHLEERLTSVIKKILKHAGTWTAVVAVVLTVGLVNKSSATRADEANAKAMLKKMSDYMGAQKAFSFDYDTYLEVVTKQSQKIGLASSGAITVNRPDKILATRTGGFADVEYAYDGKTLTMLGKNSNSYAQADVTGTLDNVIDDVRTKFHRPIPGADLLMSNIYDQLMPEVLDSKDLGSGVIGGIECDHVAFRTKDVDWEMWIAQGNRPYPCRYQITSTHVAGAPQYRIDLRGFKTGAEVVSAAFSLKVPEGAKKLTAGDLKDFDELPAIFAQKKDNRGH